MSLSAIVKGPIRQRFGHYKVIPAGAPGYVGDGDADPAEPHAWCEYVGPKNPDGAKRAKFSAFAGGTEFGHVHMGVDIGCAIGTAVRAPGPGVVVAHSSYLVLWQGKKVWGFAVVFKLDSGRVLYVDHLSKFVAPEGKRLATGGLIARTGNSGASRAPHAHIERWASYALFYKATRLNPELF